VLDVLTHYPRRYLDRTRQSHVDELVPGEEAMVLVRVRSARTQPTRNRRRMVVVDVTDGTGSLKLTFFNQPFREKQLPPGTEAVLFAQGVTTVLKGAVGRGRPFLSDGTDPGDYHPGKGFSQADYTSFPSGHTSTAFAAAAAVTNETTRWWPRSVWIVGPLMYGGATAVGLSRMYHNRHWGSDVLLGAAIGTFSGRKVVQYAHGHPNNRLDRIMLSTRVVPDGRGGVAIGSSFQIP